MKISHVKMTSMSPLSQGKKVEVPKKEKELEDKYEERTWREKLHYDQDNIVFIPGIALKNCLSEAAKYLSISVPGKGQQTYTKHFEAGIMVLKNMPIFLKETPITRDSVSSQRMFVPSDGKRGGNKRVYKNFPVIPDWEGTAEFFILDETITEDVFRSVIEQAGMFIGLGCLRPRNNGMFGRFKAKIVDFAEEKT